MRKLIALLILLLCCGNCYALSGYSFTGQISVDETKVIADTTDFTVTLTSFPDAFYTACKNDGSDITVTTSDQTTKIDRLINGFNKTNKKLVLKFKASALSTTANTIFYIYAGNSVASESNINPYTSGYKGVWELEELPDGTTDQIQDDTSNNKDMTTYGSMTSSNSVTGKIGNAFSFNGSSQYLRRSGSVSTSHYGTMYGWLSATGVSSMQTLVGWGGGPDENSKSNVRLYLESSNIKSYQRYASGTQNAVRGNTTLSINTWYFFTLKTDGSAYYFRVNSTTQTKTVVLGSDNGNWFGDCGSHINSGYTSIGAIYNYGGAYMGVFLGGKADYVHITDDQISNNDLGTIYNMTNDQSTFYSITDQSAGTSIIPQAQYYYNLLRSNNQ